MKTQQTLKFQIKTYGIFLKNGSLDLFYLKLKVTKKQIYEQTILLFK